MKVFSDDAITRTDLDELVFQLNQIEEIHRQRDVQLAIAVAGTFLFNLALIVVLRFL
jgi:hypothetical protein